MNFVYLATPYAGYKGNLATAHDAACRFAGKLIDAGWPVFSPIAHTHHIADHIRAAPKHDSGWWVEFDRPFMDAAGALVVAMMPGWEASKGVRAEIEYMEAQGKPVAYVPIDGEVPPWDDMKLRLNFK